MTICLFFRAVHAERMVAGMRDASSPYALKIRSGLNPQQIMTTGLAGGLTQPYKGMVPAALKRSEDLTTAPISHGSPFKGAVRLSKKPLCIVAKWLFVVGESRNMVKVATCGGRVS